MTIQVSGSCITFSDSTVQCTAAVSSDKYICAIACACITAGQPVAINGSCGVCVSSGALYCVNPSCSYCLGCANYCSGQNDLSDLTSLRFGCSENCFVTVYAHPGNVGQYCPGYCYYDAPYICITVSCVNPGGTYIATTCLCCISSTTLAQGWPTLATFSSCGGCGCAYQQCWQLIGKLLPIRSVSGNGTTGAVIFGYQCANLCYQCACVRCFVSGMYELFFCYCTTTNQISLVRNCCSNDCNATCLANCVGTNCCIVTNGCCSNIYHYSTLTPDGCYWLRFVTQVTDPCCDNCNPLASWQVNGTNCSCICAYISVKSTTDTACYLCWPAANSCTVTLQSFLPAVNALPFMTNPQNGYSCWVPYTTSGWQFFTYATDNWILGNFYTQTLSYCNLPSTPYNCCPCCFSCCTINCLCFYNQILAFKPISDGCYAMTCNSICPCALSACSIPYFQSFSCSCLPGACTQMNRTTANCYQCAVPYFAVDLIAVDNGDCIKRLMTTAACALNGIACCSQSTNQLYRNVACYCIGTGPCICYKSSTNFIVTGCNNLCNPCGGGWWYWDLPCGLLCCSWPCYYGTTSYCGIREPFYGFNNLFVSNGIQDVLLQASIPYCTQLNCYNFAFNYTYSSAWTPYANIICNNGCSCQSWCCIGGVYNVYPDMSINHALIDTCVYTIRGKINIDANSLSGANGFLINNTTSFSTGTNVQCYNSAYSTNIWNYNTYPFTMQSGALLITAGNHCPFVGCSGSVSLGVMAATLPSVTAQCFVGIAQNTVSPGGIVCYATVGMTDRSPFSNNFTNGTVTNFGFCYLCCIYCCCTGYQYSLPAPLANNWLIGVACVCQSGWCTLPCGSLPSTSTYDVNAGQVVTRFHTIGCC